MTSLDKPDIDTAPVSRRRMWAILGLVVVVDALDVIDGTVTNIAAPTIAADLDGGVSLIKWLGPAYMLAMGILLLVGGRLGDKFGQRRLFLIGIGGFTLASALAGFAPDPVLIIIARVTQGAFGALLIPQGMAIMTKAFSPDMLAKAFGLFGPILGISAVIGPVFAGLIIDADMFGLSWRPIFLLTIVLGLAGLLTAAKLLPRDDGDRSTVIDGRAAGLLGLAMLAMMYGLIEGSTNGWTAGPVTSVAVGVLLFVAFAYRQRTAANPLIVPSLLKNRGFTSGMLVGLVSFIAGTGLFFVLSLFMQEGLHASPRTAALNMVPLTAGLIVAAFAAMGGLVTKLGRTLVFIGLGISIIGSGWLLVLVNHSGTHVSLWALAPAFLVIGIGTGLCYTTIPTIAFGDAKPEEAGSASGSLTSMQQLSTAIGSATVSSVFYGYADSGYGHAMQVTLVVVLVATALSIPFVTLMPRQAPAGPPEGGPAPELAAA